MTAPPSPSLLQASPKRAPGVKRLNKMPWLIGAGVGAIFVGAVGYTFVQRSQKNTADAAAQVAANKPQGGKPPAFLKAEQNHGQVRASLTARPTENVIPVVARVPTAQPTTAAPTTPATTAEPQTAQSGTDLDEQARARAWTAYYQQQAQLQAARFEMEIQARHAGNDPLQSSTGGQSQNPGDPAAQAAAHAAAIQAAAEPGGKPASPYSTGGTDPAGQTGKQAFLRTPGDPLGQDEDLQGSVHGPKPLTIMEGTPIPGRLVDGATSDSPGQLIAEVSTNVYDDMTGTVLLIPQFTRIVTTYDTAISTGQDRVGVIAQRLIFPDTSSRQLGSMQIADQAGFSGLKDLLKTYFWEKFGSALAVSLIGAGAQLAQPQQSAFSGNSPTSSATGAFTQQLSQFGMEQARAGSIRPNTIELRTGLPLVIKINKDLRLPPYVDHRDMAASAPALPVSLGRLVQ